MATNDTAAHQHVHDLVDTLRPVVSGVPDDALSGPTPCPDWDVRALANHMLGTIEAMRRVGADETLDEDDPWGAAGDHMSEDWRKDLGERLSGFAEAWDSPDAFEGEAMGGKMPKQMIGLMAYTEALLHGWDLARASGQEVAYDEGVVAAALEAMGQIGEMGRQQGAFGPLVDLPAAATALDQVLAQAGRDPGWTSG
jgi:uncharacterized protein (TIGR03086 family)